MGAEWWAVGEIGMVVVRLLCLVMKKVGVVVGGMALVRWPRWWRRRESPTWCSFLLFLKYLVVLGNFDIGLILQQE